MSATFWNNIRRRKHNFAHEEGHALHRVLGVRDLTFLGIAAIIGGGIFSSVGKACAAGGPGVILLFIICAVACGFAAMCYAEFASRIPVAGSAYTYAYASFGELFAWIIGWALLMEYSIGNIYVAFSWSGYFTHLLENLGLHLPAWVITDYKSAAGAANGSLKDAQALAAWKTAPIFGGLRIILDLPALFINVIITWLVYTGIKESRNASNIMVMIKIAVIILVIGVGFFYVDTAQLTPFMPKGFSGVMAGVSAVFFTFIGFDAVSTMAEETKNPQRDLPRGMFYSLLICTVLYVLISLVLTGMMPYDQLGVDDPLATVLQYNGIKWLEYLVSISAVVAMASVLLVFQMGQPRIWMSMSRDGLLPKKFSEVHPKYKTPGFSTIITGLVVGIPILFTDENFVLDFTSIGTLFAFVLVCGGVLLLPPREREQGAYHLPFISSRMYFPILLVSAVLLITFFAPDFWIEQIHHIPSLIYALVMLILLVFSMVKNWNLIPVLGLATCLYLLTGMTANNWLWFFIWFAIGLVVYFLYGYKRSKLRHGKEGK
jgi:APA family basic amino acid/polyamine antiporter